MTDWTPELDKLIVRLRDEEHLTFRAISKRLAATKNSTQSRYYRVKGIAFPSDNRHRNRHAGKPFRASHQFKTRHQPSRAPFAPDDSEPDFAWDDEHCGAVLAAGGFMALAFRSRRVGA